MAISLSGTCKMRRTNMKRLLILVGISACGKKIHSAPRKANVNELGNSVWAAKLHHPTGRNDKCDQPVVLI
jgi:hypothetical protein